VNLWVSQSDSRRQIVLSAVCALAGLALAVGFRDFGALGANARAGFLLGVLLLLIGVAGVLVSGRQTVIVDPKARRITVEDATRFGTKSRSIAFGEVTGVSVGYLGKKSNFVTWYYLVLALNSGEQYPLFAPGRFFEGGSDRSTVESWQRRLEGYLSGPDAAGGVFPASH
jgi:hypothetical protein